MFCVTLSFLVVEVVVFLSNLRSFKGSTPDERNMFRPRFVCTTTICPSTWMNLNGPSRDLPTERYTTTSLSARSSREHGEDSPPFFKYLCLSPKSFLQRACAFSVYFIALSIRRALRSWVDAKFGMADHYTALNAGNARHSPSRPIAQFIANTNISEHCWSMVWLPARTLTFS